MYISQLLGFFFFFRVLDTSLCQNLSGVVNTNDLVCIQKTIKYDPGFCHMFDDLMQL